MLQVGYVEDPNLPKDLDGPLPEGADQLPDDDVEDAPSTPDSKVSEPAAVDSDDNLLDLLHGMEEVEPGEEVEEPNPPEVDPRVLSEDMPDPLEDSFTDVERADVIHMSVEYIQK